MLVAVAVALVIAFMQRNQSADCASPPEGERQEQWPENEERLARLAYKEFAARKYDPKPKELGERSGENGSDYDQRVDQEQMR